MRKELPTATGYYWWILKCDGLVSAKEIVNVTKYQDKFYASGGEYDFEIKEDNLDEGEEQYWQYIPEPEDP